MVVLNCIDIKKSFGSVVALNGASISLKQGEIRAILGGNGSGKSTMAKILGGAVKPDSGRIKLYGKGCVINSPKQAKNNGIIITYQELSLVDNLTVETNILLSRLPLYGKMFVNLKNIDEKAFNILEEMNLAHLSKKKVGELGLNQQYMVEFAKAVVQKPKILIIDEVTSALHANEVEIVRKIIHRLINKGCSIMFITHRMGEIYSICSSVTVMKNGISVGTYDLSKVEPDELLSYMTEQSIEEIRKYIPVSKQAKTDVKVDISDNPILSISELHIPKFRTKISFDVYPSEMLGLAGLQGQGQSTIVRSIFGTQGTVTIKLKGKDIRISSPEDAVRNKIAFISGDRQRESLFACRSISENIEVVNDNINRKIKIDEINLLKKYRVVYNTTKEPISSLSGGNQQKVVIARWMVTDPHVLLLDDPTKGVDVQARRDFHEIIYELIMAGSVVIFLSSDEEELIELSKKFNRFRLLVMNEGEIVSELKGSNITIDNIISASLTRRV